MIDTPWLGDACSLVEAFRAGERSVLEELEACIAAIEASDLNAFCHLDLDRARDLARRADVWLPFGGVPAGIKELDMVKGWPATEASLVFGDRIADYTNTHIDRLLAAGLVPVGQTTASEFGGLNVSKTKLHGITGNGWDATKTAGGSSAGSAAAVAGGLVPIATGGDGGGSIRIPASYNGLVGMKGTAGRIPRGPHTVITPLTVVLGCLARSVRDVARWYDVANGYDARDPYSLPRVDGWEEGLGSHELHGMRVAISPAGGLADVETPVADMIQRAGEHLAEVAGLEIVDTPVHLPLLGVEWAMTNLATLRMELADRWPACAPDLTDEIAFGMTIAEQMFGLEMAANAERTRVAANEAMAALFDRVDFVITTVNPHVAHDAQIALYMGKSDEPIGVEELLSRNGSTTIPANICGNPAISIPAGTVDGLPVGMQVIGRHHEDALLLDLALAMERTAGWPLVAPGAPR
jgi:aspartyl-tRNA(Asn)/glutamyl-tRNA(Gln) amidotransferase subunit A